MIREIVAILVLLGVVLAAVHLRDHWLQIEIVKELPNDR